MKTVLLAVCFIGTAFGNSLFSQEDTIYEFMTYGYGAHYGFDYYVWKNDTVRLSFIPVAGCIVSPELEDSVRKHNAVTDSLLVLRFGKDWRSDYEQQREKRTLEGDVLYARIDLMLIQQDFLKKKLHETGLVYDQLRFEFENAPRKDWIIVYVIYDIAMDFGLETRQLYKLEIKPAKARIRIREKDKLIGYTKTIAE